VSVIENGKLAQTSVSQLERFDPAQFGGCPRKWWFEYVAGLKPDQGEAAKAGDAGHILLAEYLRTGIKPVGRVKMGKHVRAAIEKGQLPKPGDDLLVEWRGDGQAKFLPIPYGDENGPAWIPLDREKTLKIAGIPLELFIDLTYRRSDVPHVLDHKFRGSLDDCKPADELIAGIQMPVYVLARQPFWPDAKRWRLTHHNVCRTAGQGSRIVTTVVELDQVLERREQIASLVTQMAGLVGATDQNDVPFNPSRERSCEAWGGCPHQSVCSRYQRRDHVDLTPEEEANLFGTTPPPKPEADSAESLFNEEPPPAAAAEEDEEAKALREHNERMAKIKADKEAKAAALAKAKADADAKAAAEKAKGAPKRENMKIVGDRETLPPPGAAPAPSPAPSPAPAAPTGAACACGEQMNPENASRLRDGSWKHIGCPKDPTPPPAAAAKPVGRPPKAAAPTIPSEVTIKVEFGPETMAALTKLLGKG